MSMWKQHVKDTKKGSFDHLNTKRKTQANVGLLLNGGDPGNWGHSRALEHLPCIALHCQDQLSGTSDPGDVGKGMLGSLPLGQEDWLREHQGKPDIHESMGPEGMHPEVLRASRHHGEAPHHHLWKVVAITRAATRKQMSSILQKGKGGPREVLASQLHLNPWKGDSASFWGPSLSIWMARRWSWVVSMDPLQLNNAWWTRLPWQWSAVHWNRLPETLWSLPHRSYSTRILCHVLQNDSAWAGSWTRWSHCEPFQPEPFSASVILWTFLYMCEYRETYIHMIIYMCICKHKETLFHCEGDEALAQAAQRGCGLTLLGDTLKLDMVGRVGSWAEGWTRWPPELPVKLSHVCLSLVC